jgi:ankyrin
MAAKHGHRDAVLLLLRKGAVSNPVSQDGITPLFSAVQQGHKDIVAVLLDKGVDVNVQPSIGGVTLLHVAAYRGDQEIITLLLNSRGDKNARMSTGERPVDLAKKQGHTALISLLEP